MLRGHVDFDASPSQRLYNFNAGRTVCVEHEGPPEVCGYIGHASLPTTTRPRSIAKMPESVHGILEHADVIRSDEALQAKPV